MGAWKIARLVAAVLLALVALVGAGMLALVDWVGRAMVISSLTGGEGSEALSFLFKMPWWASALLGAALFIYIAYRLLNGVFSAQAPSSLAGKPQQISPDVFQRRDVKLSEVITEDRRITNKTFIDCAIYGPGILWPVRTTVDGTFYGANQFIEPPGRFPPEGAIIVKDCVFQKCRFRHCSIYVQGQRAAISSSDQSLSETPAAIAGETRNVE